MSFTGFKSLSANFTPTPNQFFDRIVGHFPSCVVTVVAVLIRSTLGWEDPVTGDRRVEAELPLSQFIRPELCESSARKGLAQAVAAGFLVQTAQPSNRDGARYALRWEDAAAQQEAIARSRRASQDPILNAPERDTCSGGLKNTPPENGGVNSGGLDSRGLKNTPPYIDKETKTPDSEKKRRKTKQTLNVSEPVNFVSTKQPKSQTGPADTPPPRSQSSGPEPHHVFEEARKAEAAKIVEELQDWGSERRHKQLLALCERKGLHHLPDQALHAVRQRLASETKRGVLENPGAYYQSVLISLLEGHQVFVPKSGEESAKDVRQLARQSLKLEG